MKRMSAPALGIVLAVSLGVAGCGVDGSLRCGARCDPDASRASASDARFAESNDSSLGPNNEAGEPDAEANTVEAGSSDAPGGDVGAPPEDAPATSAGDAAADGGNDAGCVLCLRVACCAPQECAASGMSCCSTDGGGCGGERGACCGSLVCTAAQRCAPSCKASGSCTSQNDCCHGTSYCDSTGNCAPCQIQNTACSTDSQCCSGICNGTVCAAANN